MKVNPGDILEGMHDLNPPLSRTPSTSDQNDTGLEDGQIPPGTTTSQSKKPPTHLGTGFYGTIINQGTIEGISHFTIRDPKMASRGASNETNLEAGLNPPGSTISQPKRPPSHLSSGAVFNGSVFQNQGSNDVSNFALTDSS